MNFINEFENKQRLLSIENGVNSFKNTQNKTLNELAKTTAELKVLIQSNQDLIVELKKIATKLKEQA